MSELSMSETIGRLEAELAAFWAAPYGASGALATKVRASTMSFAEVTALSDLERARETTEALSETHPGRAFLFSADGRLAPWEARGEARAACRIGGGEVPLCYDWIELSFGAAAAERAGSVIATLALPEVPVVVEIGRGAARPLVSSLVPRADRLVVDSAHTSPARIAEIASSTDAPIGDRQFVRGYAWRELVARFFDDALPALSAIDEVTIARTPGGATEPAALLFGWLGSRLGWGFSSRNTAQDRRGQEVRLALRDDPREDLGPGEITGVWIEARLEGAPLSLACVRDADIPRQVSWTRRGARTSTHEHALGQRDEAWVLVKAIDATESDRVYRDALVLAAEWSGR